MRLSILVLLAACGDVEKPGGEGNAEEVITTVTLVLTPGAGEPITATFSDPDQDGDPVVDAIAMSDAEDYAVAVTFTNELEDPPEDITAEVAAESDAHQVFFTGSAIDAGFVAYAYGDEDANGLPVGLAGTLTTGGAGAGTLVVTLRHLPPEGDVAVKTGTLADDVAAGGFEAIPGESDVSVTFELAVAAD